MGVGEKRKEGGGGNGDRRRGGVGAVLVAWTLCVSHPLAVQPTCRDPPCT